MVGSQWMVGAPDRTPPGPGGGHMGNEVLGSLSFPERIPESPKQTQPVTLGQPSPRPDPQPKPQASTAAPTKTSRVLLQRPDPAESRGAPPPLEKEMAIHSSILAWKIPWIEELGRL